MSNTCKNTENSQNPGNRWKYCKILKTLALGALILCVLQKINIVFKSYRKKNHPNWTLFIRYNFGSIFGARVSFHTAILQSWEFQENLGRTVVVLPL